MCVCVCRKNNVDDFIPDRQPDFPDKKFEKVTGDPFFIDESVLVKTKNTSFILLSRRRSRSLLVFPSRDLDLECFTIFYESAESEPELGSIDAMLVFPSRDI